MDENKIIDLLKKLNILNSICDVYRIIDPLSKRVYESDGEKVNISENHCYNFWEKGKACDNCISMRVLSKNRVFVKIETQQNNHYLVIAAPYEKNKEKYIIELLIDISSSIVDGELENSKGTRVDFLIQYINDIAIKDSLTGVYNRRYIDERLPIEIFNALFTKQSLSVVMVDIDNLKLINDQYGHLAGDAVISAYIERIFDSLKRQSDWIARYGGDEFLICLPGASTEKAIDIVNELRNDLENLEYQYKGRVLKITFSFGIASNFPGNYLEMKDLIDTADKKLYLAKRSGKNRIEY